VVKKRVLTLYLLSLFLLMVAAANIPSKAMITGSGGTLHFQDRTYESRDALMRIDVRKQGDTCYGYVLVNVKEARDMDGNKAKLKMQGKLNMPCEIDQPSVTGQATLSYQLSPVRKRIILGVDENGEHIWGFSNSMAPVNVRQKTDFTITLDNNKIDVAVDEVFIEDMVIDSFKVQ